jgi:hypothetical protein
MRPYKIFRLHVIVTVLTFTLTCQGQDSSAYTLKSNEISIIFNRSFDFGVNPPLSIGYKRIYEKGALRLASGLYFDSDSYDADLNESKGVGYTFSPRIGYEFHQWFGRFRLQYGSDLIYSFWRNDNDYNNGDPNNPHTHKIIYNKYSVRPFFGLTFFIHESVSLSTETYLDIGYYTRIDEHTDAGEVSSRKSHGTSVYFGPLGVLSFTYHF